MKDFSSKDLTVSRIVVNKQNDAVETINGGTNMKKSSTDGDEDPNDSVLQVLFKNDAFARKYRSKVEKFLKDLLEEGEEFIVYHPSNSNSEKEYSAEDLKTFHIDKIKSDTKIETPQILPAYSSQYKESLESISAVKDEPEKLTVEKQSMVTCFNCLGNHHMKKCPNKLDYSRISMNKRDILMDNSIRYHSDDDRNSLTPGIWSDKLREALGLQKDELPLFIYHMRVLGYPPGWLNEAVFEKSGLSMYDQDGRAISEDSKPESTAKGTLYDGHKFIEYPGFNMPVPHGVFDDWKKLKMPPAQDHQQLQQALKSPNIILSNNTCKRRQDISGNRDIKKHKNVEDNSTSPSTNVFPKREPLRSPLTLHDTTPGLNQEIKRLSLSISVTPGTPILRQGNTCERLPDADKFAEGITEHLPFENLPDAVGSYDKMRGVISNVQKKLFSLKS